MHSCGHCPKYLPAKKLLLWASLPLNVAFLGPISLSLLCMMICEQGTCEPRSLWLTLAHSCSIMLTLALTDSLWLYLWLTLSLSLWLTLLTLALSGSLRRSSAHKALARLPASVLGCPSLSCPVAKFHISIWALLSSASSFSGHHQEPTTPQEKLHRQTETCVLSEPFAWLPSALPVVVPSMRNERSVPVDPICIHEKFQWATCDRLQTVLILHSNHPIIILVEMMQELGCLFCSTLCMYVRFS